MWSISKSVSPGFVLLCLWFGAVCGWQPLGEVLLAAAAHEGGHLLLLRLWGAPIRSLRVRLWGAVLETDCAHLSYGRELAAVLAGPGINLLLAVTAARLGAFSFAGANLSLCFYNLLPVRPLDGGRALELLLSWGTGPSAGVRLADWIGAAASVTVFAGAAALMVRRGGSLWLLPPAAGLLAAGLRPLFWEKGRASGCSKGAPRKAYTVKSI